MHTFPTDDGGVAMKCPTEIAITDRREFELSNLGFLPLLHCKGNDFAAFMGTQSCQKPKTYFDPAANANAELSTKLNFMLCVSRFAHYLKVMARDKIGSFMEVSECASLAEQLDSEFRARQSGGAGEETQGEEAARRRPGRSQAGGGQTGLLRGGGLPAAALPAGGAVHVDAAGGRGAQEEVIQGRTAGSLCL